LGSTTTSQLKRPMLGSKLRAKGIQKGSLVWRTGLSGVPPDSVRCTRRLRVELLSLGNFQSRRAIIHRTVRCTPDSVRCSKRTRLWNLAASGIHNGCSAIIHRTVRCNSRATATSRQRSPATAINARQSARKSGTRVVAHRTLYSTCLVRHRTFRRAQNTVLQRSNPNGIGDVAGAPDMSGVHRTVRCTIRQSASPNG
jgi:hypothetical protein